MTSITRGKVRCSECARITWHLYGKSVLGRLWKECEDCGRTSKLDQ